MRTGGASAKKLGCLELSSVKLEGSPNQALGGENAPRVNRFLDFLESVFVLLTITCERILVMVRIVDVQPWMQQVH